MSRRFITKYEYSTAMKMVATGLIPQWSPSAEDEFFDQEYPAYTVALSNRARSVLTPREGEVIACRYGFLGRGPMDRDETAAYLGIAYTTVDTLEKRALSRMREALGVRLRTLRDSGRRNATPEELKAIKERNALSWNVQDWKRPHGPASEER